MLTLHHDSHVQTRVSTVLLDHLLASDPGDAGVISCSVVQLSSQGATVSHQTITKNISSLLQSSSVFNNANQQQFLTDLLVHVLVVIIIFIGLVICWSTIRSSSSSASNISFQSRNVDIATIDDCYNIQTEYFNDDCEVFNDMMNSLDTIADVVHSNEVNNVGVDSVFYCVEGCFVPQNHVQCHHQLSTDINND